MKILFLSRWFPYPADNGSKIRILNLLQGLVSKHDVTLLSFTDRAEVSLELSQVRIACKDVHVIPWREFNPYGWHALAGFFSSRPRSIVDTFSPLMAAKIVRILDEERFDVIVASQLAMAAYYPYFRNAPTLFEELEIGLAYENLAQGAGWTRLIRRKFTRSKFHIYLSYLLKQVRSVSVVSEKERELVAHHFLMVKNISVIPNGVDLEKYSKVTVVSKPNTMIFTGSFRYRVNYEAMVWFVEEVLPLVLERIPSAELIITGDHLNLPLPSMRNIRLTGHLEDVREWIASSTVSLAPLWRGGGTRLKIIESMALATPVVATSKGAEGLNAKNGVHLMIADTPEAFADCIMRVMYDRSLAKRISTSALQFVKAHYDWGVILPQFIQLVERTALQQS